MLCKYFYEQSVRLDNAVKDCNYRYVRRDLDEVDLLEEIIAISNQKFFNQVVADICNILKFVSDDD